jgi:hypothetical protein
MLLILVLIITEFSIQFVESILLFLDKLMTLLDFHAALDNSFLFGAQKTLNVENSLFIILNFSSQN